MKLKSPSCRVETGGTGDPFYYRGVGVVVINPAVDGKTALSIVPLDSINNSASARSADFVNNFGTFSN